MELSLSLLDAFYNKNNAWGFSASGKYLRSALCSPVIFSKVLATRKTNLITARARKKPRSARILEKTIRNPFISGIACEHWRLLPCFTRKEEAWLSAEFRISSPRNVCSVAELTYVNLRGFPVLTRLQYSKGNYETSAHRLFYIIQEGNGPRCGS